MADFTPLEEFDVITPLGPAVCVGIWIGGEAVEWATFIKATGEPWFWRNPELRLGLSITNGRAAVSPFAKPSRALQREIDRYRANGWLPEIPHAP